MSLPFLIGAALGSAFMLTVARAPAHRALAVVRARIARRQG